MPVISTRRYSTTGSSSYLPPSIGGTTSSLANLGKTTTSSGYSSSSYRSNSLSNSYSTSYSSGIGSGTSSSSSSSYLSRPSYRSGLYSSSSSLGGSTRTSSYLTGGNNDSTATLSSRFGVSNYKYTRSSSDRDTITSTRGLTGKTHFNNNNNNNNINNNNINYNNTNTSTTITTTTTSIATGLKSLNNKTKTIQTKPPIGTLSKRQTLRENRLRDNSTTRPLSIPDISKIGVTSKSDSDCNANNSSKFTSSLSSCTSTGYNEDRGNKRTISSSLSSSSLALQVATSALDLQEKYSPAYYIPKCELSRSRSLSEAIPNSISNDHNLTNSSSNVNNLLQQKENKEQQHQQQKQQQQVADDIDCVYKPKSSSPSLSSISASKDNCSSQTVNKVRNTSIRSALPSSPTLSRYWDREGRSAISSRNISDGDDYAATKSSVFNSSESYDKIPSEQREGLCGLRNIGNTCFMNSVIQCLSHTRELTKFLKNQVRLKSTSKDEQILCEFAKLIREMWSPNTRSVTPHELKSAFSSKHRMYSGYNQQDAQEFLRFFLDSLHCALNTGAKADQLNIDDSLSDNKKADLTWEHYSKIENSVIKDLFVGQLKSSLKCTTCGNTSVTFDPFWDLSVPLPSSSRCKLDACLDLFIREEVLDGDEMPTCSKCQTRRKCTKRFTIQRFPKYLVIHLKRFSETRWSKLSNIVEFPTGEKELNMSPYASTSSSNSLYSLYGISNHMGSTAGGHYVALCKHPVTKRWHEFNDNVVSDEVSENILVSSSAYLLFYERAY